MPYHYITTLLFKSSYVLDQLCILIVIVISSYLHYVFQMKLTDGVFAIYIHVLHYTTTLDFS